MGNACINFRRKKRLHEEEVDFRRKMEARIQQSSKRLKNVPADQLNKILNNQNDLINLRPADLSRSNCTPLRPNSKGVFVEVDQQYIEEQLNNLRRLDKLNLIRANNEWTSELLNQQDGLSNLNQLRLLQSNSNYNRLSNQLNSFDNKSFVNTSIDSNLFDQNLFNVNNVQTNFLNNRPFSQQINQMNGQLDNHSSLHSINKLMKSNLFHSDLLLNNSKDQLNQFDQSSASNNILDMAANRIFSELANLDNRYTFSEGDFQFENRNLCYLPLDGFMKFNGNNVNLNLLYDQRISNHFDTVQLNHIATNRPNDQLNQTQFFNRQTPESPFNLYLDTMKTVNHLRNRSSLDLLPSLNNENLVLPIALPQSNDLISIDNLKNSAVKTSEQRQECSMTVQEHCVESSERSESIEEEQMNDKDDLNDSGNGSGCPDRQISRAESIENQMINSQIEMEPWFFAQINSRIAAEHVLRMKGNRVGAFLVRHAQQIKFTADAPFVLSLKVVDSADKPWNEKQTFDKSPNEKMNLQHHSPSYNHLTSDYQHHVKITTKNILHYKIYSRLACSNCDLKMYYINPANQFTTIRQLISYYSDNPGLPIRLSKPCLPFDYLNCCYSGNVSSFVSSNGATNKLKKANCEICNELMSSARMNRWSTGNLSGITNQPSQANSTSSTETYFQTYIEQNPDSFIRHANKDDSNTSTAVQILSRSLNSIRAKSVDRISNNGIPVNSTNRILTEIKFEDEINRTNLAKLNNLKSNTNNKIQFSTSLDDVGLNNSNNMLCVGLSTRLSLKDRFRNRSLVSINYSDGNSHNLTSSGSSLSRKSSDSRKSHVRTGSFIGGHKHRISSSSFKENIHISADNLKRRSSSIRLKPGNSGKYHLTKVNSASVTNVSLLENSNA